MPLTLFQALYHHSDEELRRFAQLMDMPVRAGIATRMLREDIQDWLRKRETVEQIYAQLDEVDRAYVAEILHYPERYFELDAFEVRYGGRPSVYRSGSDSSRKLCVLRLLADRNEVYREVQPVLLKLVAPPPVVQVPTLRAPIGRVVRATEADALHDVLILLNALAEGKIPTTQKTRTLGSPAVREIARMQRGGDWYDDAGGSNLIRAFGWAVMLENCSHYYAAEPAADALRHVWTKWTTASSRDELRRLHMPNVYKSDYQFRRRRKRVCEALAACPPGEWIAVDDFCNFLCAAGYYFPLCWGREQALALLRTYIACFLMEYAATAGLIDIAYDAGGDSRYDGLRCFRVTPTGAWLLGTNPNYDAPQTVAPRKLVALSSLILIFDAEPTPEQIVFLDRYCDRETTTTWRLSRGKTAEAMQRGFTPEMLRDFIERYDDQPLPERMQTWLKVAK